MEYHRCGKCKKLSLEFTTPARLKKMKKDETYPKNSALANISIDDILKILGMIGVIVRFFTSENKSVVFCHNKDCGLYIDAEEYRKKYGDS